MGALPRLPCHEVKLRFPRAQLYIYSALVADPRSSSSGTLERRFSRKTRSTVLVSPVTSDMSTSVLDIQRRLHGLSASDENYRPLLLELLSHKSLKPYIHGLQGSSLQGFVELLDEVKKAEIPMTSADLTD